jgi:hypothetical protein
MQGELDFDQSVQTCIVDCPEPGLYQGIDFKTYAAWQAVNSGVLKWGQISPKHFHAALNGLLPSDDTSSKKLGRAIHCYILERDRYETDFNIVGECMAMKEPKRKGDTPGKCTNQSKYVGKDGVHYCGVHSPSEAELDFTKEIISETQHHQCVRVAAALKEHPAMRWLKRKGYSETSMVWDYRGLRMKGRLDRISLDHGTILDLKKIRVGYGTTERCQRQAYDLGYHIQAAGYVKGVRRLTGASPVFLWIFVEENEPFDVQVIQAGEQDLLIGLHEIKTTLDRYIAARDSAELYGYVRVFGDGDVQETNIHPGILPMWVLRDYQKAGVI